MNDINVEIVSFQDFLAEDTKSISDSNLKTKNGDQTPDKLKEPAEHKFDKNGICTDERQSKANKTQGDKKAYQLKEESETVGKKDRVLDDEDDSDEDDYDEDEDDSDEVEDEEDGE